MAQETSYHAFADRLLEDGVLTDPWLDGEPRFQAEAVILGARELEEMYEAAENVAWVHQEIAVVVGQHPELLDDFFRLTPAQKLMWQASMGRWHGIARADVFRTRNPSNPTARAGALAVCELNSDTPTGEAEAIVLGEIARNLRQTGTNPNEQLESRLAGLIRVHEIQLESSLGGPCPPPALVYPTEITEDLSLVRLYRRLLARREKELALGSPFNLSIGDDNVPRLLGRPFGVLLRHYKTDWWGERLPVWTDSAPFEDTRPLNGPLGLLLTAELEDRCRIVNPFGAVVTQNKRALALLFERRDLFSASTLKRAEQIPETIRLEAMHRELLSVQKDQWVLKSDYGAEGDEVHVGPELTQTEWDECLDKAIAPRWVVQRYFDVARDDLGRCTNFGVFLVAGRACGVYTRVSSHATAVDALSAPTLVID